MTASNLPDNQRSLLASIPGAATGLFMVAAVITFALPIPALALPNLKVTYTSVAPSNSSPGGRVKVTFAVANDGDADAGASQAALYYSNTTTITQDQDHLLATVDVPAITAKGQVSDLSADVTIPTTAPTDQLNRYIGIVADSYKIIDESNENDNVAKPTVTLYPPPDLRVSLEYVSQPVSGKESHQSGDSVSVVITIIKSGNAPANPVRVRLYYSDDSTITIDDTWLDYEYTTELGFNITQDTPQTAMVNLPAGTPVCASCFIGAIVDPDDEIYEGTGTNPDPEANNTRPIPIEVTEAICFNKPASDESACGDHGTCVGPDNCMCDENWAGHLCEDWAVVEELVADDGAPDAVTVQDVQVTEAAEDVAVPDTGTDEGPVADTGADTAAADVIWTDTASGDEGPAPADGGCSQSGKGALPGSALLLFALAVALTFRRMASTRG